ncbi:unnamed protein product, partial [marine sediment metagenome]
TTEDSMLIRLARSNDDPGDMRLWKGEKIWGPEN